MVAPFTLVQQGTQQLGTGSLSLPLPSASTQVGTILIATIAVSDASAAVFPPANVTSSGVINGWQMAASVATTGGVLYQWHFADNPGGLYPPNAPPVFTCIPNTDHMNGAVSEFNPPTASSQVIIETRGFNSAAGAGTAFSVTTATGAFNGDLAIFSQAVFTTGNLVPSGFNFTVPNGYTAFGQLRNGTNTCWMHDYNPSISTAGTVAGYQTASGGFSFVGGGTTGTTVQGWSAALCTYRSMVAAPVNIGGAEPTNCIDIDPTGQVIFVGGDVEGAWRTANYGDDWIPSVWGMVSGDQICFGDVKFSTFSQASGQSGYLYACAGKGDSNAGGFYASADGGCTFNKLSGQPLFYGNATASPPRPSGVNQDQDRTCNQLIAMDNVNNLIYIVTRNLGVMKSTDFGKTWNQIGLAQTNFYPRCIVLNPSNPTEAWVGMWDTGNGNGSIYHSTSINTIPNGTTGASGWTQLTGMTGGDATVACMTVVGSGTNQYLYVAGAGGASNNVSGGIYRWSVANGGSLVSCNSSTPTAVDLVNSTWVTIAGYASGGNHTIIAGCSNGAKRSGSSHYTNVIKLVFTGANLPAAYTDLTGFNPITLSTIPPFGQPWWHFGASWQFWLGGNDSVNPQVLIDPNNRQRIYLCNSGGFFRSYDGGNTWAIAVHNMSMLAGHGFAIDPASGTHFITSGDDFNSIDFTDPTGNQSNSITTTNPGTPLTGPHRECHAIATDPVDGRVFVGTNTSYSQPIGGEVVWRAPGNTANSAWTSLGLANFLTPTNLPGCPAVIGLFAGRDGSNNRFVIAVAQNSGTYKYTFTNGQWVKCTENDSAILPGSGNAIGQFNTFAAGVFNQNIYLWDRHSGIYRSTDYGSSWARIWVKTIANQNPNKQCGGMAINPNQAGELWVAADDNLYWLNNAGSGTVGSGITATAVGAPFNGGCTSVAFDSSGKLFALALPGSGASSSNVTTLYANATPTAGGGSWTDATGGDNSVASAGVPAGQIGISSAGWMWGANQERFGFYVQLLQLPVFSATATLTGAGTLTAVGSVKNTNGTANLTGAGSLTANGFVIGNFIGTASLTGKGTLSAQSSNNITVVQQVAGSSSFDYGISTTEITTSQGNGIVVLAGWDLSDIPIVAHVQSGTAPEMPAVYVNDSAGNYWYHVTTSVADNFGARVTAWVCPNANAVQWISVSLTSFASSLAYLIVEVAGLPPYFNVDILNSNAVINSTSISVTAGATTDIDFCFAVFAAGIAQNRVQQVKVTGSPWRALNVVTAGSVPASVTIYPYSFVSTAATSLNTTFSIPGSPRGALAGLVFGFHSTAVAPLQLNPNMPVLRVEAGFGFIPGDPSQSPPAWADITARCIGSEGEEFIEVVMGRQYELSVAEAGQITIGIDNHDGAFTPGNINSPYYPNVVLGTPIRISAWWSGRWYYLAYGYVERWPQEWPDLPQWGISRMVATDAIAVTAAASLHAAMDGESLLDAPYVLIPAYEQYTSFSNGIDPVFQTANAQGLLAQNISRINQRSGMYVGGSFTFLSGSSNVTTAINADTGQTTSLLGTSNTGFGTQNITQVPTQPSSGPGIIYTDPNIPNPNHINGVTVNFWVIVPPQAISASIQPTVFSAFSSPSNYGSNTASFSAQIRNFTGGSTMKLTFADASTASVNFIASVNAQMITFIFSGSSLQVYVNAVLQGVISLTISQVTNWTAVSWGCPTYAYDAKNITAGSFLAFGLSIYDFQMPVQRIVSQYNTGNFGQQGADALVRLAQILDWAHIGIPKAGRTTFSGVSDGVQQGPAYNLQGASASDAINQIAVNHSGMVVATPSGALEYIHKWALFNQTAVVSFGDNPPVPPHGYSPASEIPYLQATSWDYDNTYVFNIDQITQQYGANNLFTVTAVNIPSQDAYFTRSALTQTITTMSNLDAYDSANWLINKYSQPALRVSSVTIDAASNPNAFPVVLGLQQGNTVNLIRRPMGGAVISEQVLIQKITHSIGAAKWQTSYQLSPYTPENAIVELDVPGFNVLGNGSLA